MPAAGVQLEGGRKFRKSLVAAGGDLRDLKEAHTQAAQLVAGAARAGAPVGDTGKLARTVRGAGSNTTATVRAGSNAVPYANPIHWGWFSRHIKPNTWVSRAAQATEPTWTPIYLTAVNAALDTIEGK